MAPVPRPVGPPGGNAFFTWNSALELAWLMAILRGFGQILSYYVPETYP
jgi:hypothetical protein